MHFWSVLLHSFYLFIYYIMKKVLLGIAAISTLLLLQWCNKKAKTVDPIQALDNPTVTSGDVVDFNTIVWWSWYSEQEDVTSLFTFKGDNTFAVNLGEKEARWPRIISEGKIFMWEKKLELIIVGENEITIDGVSYFRNEELN